MAIEDHFPGDYRDSRERFCALVPQGAQVGNFEVAPHLWMDHFHLPAQEKGETLVALTSGVHGVEAYAGSAVQQLFMQEIFPWLKRAGVLLIHAVNPYGFCHHRRATQENIDLNRNLDTDTSLFSTDNPGYDSLRPILEPSGPVDRPSLSLARITWKLAKRLTSGEMNLAQLTRATAQGQYRHPKGIFYGGQRFAPQVPYLRHLLQNAFQGYRRIFFFDIHTGLGERGRLHLIPGHRASSPQALKQIEDIFGIRPSCSTDTGFYQVRGDMIDFADKLAPQESDMLALTMEYGTLGNGPLAKLRTIGRIIQENQARHYGCARPEWTAQIKKNFRELSCPPSRRWRLAVLRQARRFFASLCRQINSGR